MILQIFMIRQNEAPGNPPPARRLFCGACPFVRLGGRQRHEKRII
jgi:hypothetical protein